MSGRPKAELMQRPWFDPPDGRLLQPFVGMQQPGELPVVVCCAIPPLHVQVSEEPASTLPLHDKTRNSKHPTSTSTSPAQAARFATNTHLVAGLLVVHHVLGMLPVGKQIANKGQS